VRAQRPEIKATAKRKLQQREYEISTGMHQGPQVDRSKFEDLVEGVRVDYVMNKRKSSRRLNDFITHLSASFSHMRAAHISTDKIKGYIAKRQSEAANGTINRELGCLKRMFRLAHQQTPAESGAGALCADVRRAQYTIRVL